MKEISRASYQLKKFMKESCELEHVYQQVKITKAEKTKKILEVPQVTNIILS
jgi:hypothetical protein